MTDGGMEDEQAKQSIVLSSMEGWVFDIENIAEKGFAAAAPRSMIFDMMRIAACLLCLACLTELLSPSRARRVHVVVLRHECGKVTWIQAVRRLCK